MDLGSDTTYSGDYTSLSNLYVEHFETGIHVKSMGNTHWWNVAVTGQSGTPSDYGVKFDGGSSNSHSLIGLSTAYCNIGLDLNTPGQGNVYLLGDMGQNGTLVKEEVSRRRARIFIGGNCEKITRSRITARRAYDLTSGGLTTLIEAGGGNQSGNETNEPVLVGTNNVLSMGHTGASGTVGGLMFFQGQGFASLSPTSVIDTVGTTTVTVAAATFTASSAAVTVTSGNTTGLTVGSMITDNGVTVTAGLTSGSPTATCASTTGLVTGGYVRGFGIPANTTISSIVTNTSFTMSANATANYTGLTVTETLVPYGTLISAIGSSSTLTLSHAAGASATSVGLTEYLKWHQSPFPSVYDNGVPTATMSNRGVIWQAISRGSSSGKGDDLPVSRLNSSGVMVTDSLVAGTLLEHTNTWLSTQTFPAVTANGIITGNAAGNIISINSTGNALNLRNQGSGMALYVQGSGGDAGFYNTGALEAQHASTRRPTAAASAPVPSDEITSTSTIPAAPRWMSATAARIGPRPMSPVSPSPAACYTSRRSRDRVPPARATSTWIAATRTPTSTTAPPGSSSITDTMTDTSLLVGVNASAILVNTIIVYSFLSRFATKGELRRVEREGKESAERIERKAEAHADEVERRLNTNLAGLEQRVTRDIHENRTGNEHRFGELSAQISHLSTTVQVFANEMNRVVGHLEARNHLMEKLMGLKAQSTHE